MIFDRLFSRAVTPEASHSGNRSLIFGLPSAGVRVDEDVSLNYSAVWAAVSMIAHTMGIVSWQVHRREDGRRERLFDDPLARLLNVTPNSEMPPQAFKQTLAVNALLWGQAFAEVERNGAGRATQLWPIPSRMVEPRRTETNRLFYRVTPDDGQAVDIPAEDMFAPIGLSFDGVNGISPIQRARESVSMGLAMEKYGASFFGNDARPSFVLETDQKLSEKAEQNIREWAQRNHGGPGRSWKPGVFEQGISLKTIGMPNDDSQFLESRQFQVKEIARWFNIPPHKIAEMSDATFSNIDSRERMYVTEAVMPWARAFEEEANRKLIPGAQRGRIFTKFDFNSLMRGDVQTRTEHYNTMFNIGAFSPNDIRRLEDMNPIRGGNQHMVPGNMVPLRQAGSQMQPQQAMFDVFLDVADRMLRKQYKAVSRMAGKDDCAERVREFYASHRDELCEAFSAPVESLAKQHQAAAPYQAVAQWAGSHCESAVDRLLVSGDIEATIKDWTQQSREMATEVIEAVSECVEPEPDDAESVSE